MGMKLGQFLRPTKWKVILALLPFIFPLVQVVFLNEGIYDLLSVDALIILGDIFPFLGYTEMIISQPFAPILQSLGWWSNNSPILFPDGPLLPGSFVVAISYATLIYLLLSLISFLRNRT